MILAAYQSKSGTLAAVTSALILAIVTIVAVFRKINGHMEATSNTVFIILISVALVSSLVAVYLSAKWLHQPEIVVNEKELQYNSLYGLYKVTWVEVDSIETTSQQSNHKIIVNLSYPQKHMSDSSGLKRAIMLWYTGRYHTPIVISVAGLSVSKESIIAAMQHNLLEAREEHQQKIAWYL